MKFFEEFNNIIYEEKYQKQKYNSFDRRMKKAIIDFTTHLFIDKILFIEIK